MNEGKKALLLLFAFFVLMGSFYFYKVNRLDKQIDQIVNEIEQEKELSTLTAEQIAKIKKQPISKEVTNYSVHLPANKGVPQILLYLNQIADKNDIDILTINMDEMQRQSNQAKSSEQPTNGLQTLAIQLKLEGDYDRMRAFIQDVYESERLIDLVNWKWEVSGESEASTKLTAELTLYTYFYPEMKDLIPNLPAIPTYKPENRTNPIK